MALKRRRMANTTAPSAREFPGGLVRNYPPSSELVVLKTTGEEEDRRSP